VRSLAIYDGWPSDVNGAGGNLAQAVASFAGFDVAVFGEGNVLPRGDPLAAAVIAGAAAGGSVCYGYINLATRGVVRPWSIDQIGRHADSWRSIGAAGLFFDCAGRDYGTTRQRFEAAVAAGQQRGMPVIANAWDPDDVLAGGSPLGPGDGYLGENDVLEGGRFQPATRYTVKLEKMASYRQSMGVALYETATVRAGLDGAARAVLAARVRAILMPYQIDAFQLTDPHYGAADNRLAAPGACEAR
jgi:hypothetical protein